ncbi:hypothetical protein NTG1052_140014 [Candidatus Nitrotoga sp. 1052]|nr:hypothetical protein NTG1052_140014 [Candidatus Nitrotoga sp. 1052]
MRDEKLSKSVRNELAVLDAQMRVPLPQFLEQAPGKLRVPNEGLATQHDVSYPKRHSHAH